MLTVMVKIWDGREDKTLNIVEIVRDRTDTDPAVGNYTVKHYDERRVLRGRGRITNYDRALGAARLAELALATARA